MYLSHFSNESTEGEPEEKRRKTTNVVIDQPATEHKVLIDNVADNSTLLDEVSNQIMPITCSFVVFSNVIARPDSFMFFHLL